VRSLNDSDRSLPRERELRIRLLDAVRAFAPDNDE
jgi:hypothetical protein